MWRDDEVCLLLVDDAARVVFLLLDLGFSVLLLVCAMDGMRSDQVI